jgi:hypothetical protein
MEYNVNNVQNKIVSYNKRESLGDTKQQRGMLRVLSNIGKLLRDVGMCFLGNEGMLGWHQGMTGCGEVSVDDGAYGDIK